MTFFFKSRLTIVQVAAGVCGGGAGASILVRVLLGTDYTVLGVMRVFLLALIPTLSLYLLIFFLNRLLIRRFGANELNLARKGILDKLVDASLRSGSVVLKRGDLLEEEAWASLSRFWRQK